MYVIYTRSELVCKRAGINQKFKESTITHVLSRAVKMQNSHKMKISEFERSANDGMLYMCLRNKHFTIWFYAVLIENGADRLLDKILKNIGLV